MVLGLYWNLRAASAPTAHASMTRRQAEEAHRIRCERFQVGDCWTWLYRDANGDPSSWERYTVSTARGSDLEIELASKFAADESGFAGVRGRKGFYGHAKDYHTHTYCSCKRYYTPCNYSLRCYQ